MRMRMNHEYWFHNSLALSSTCNVDVTYVKSQLKHLAGAHKALVRVRTSERRDMHTCVWLPAHTLHESGQWQPRCYQSHGSNETRPRPSQRTGRVTLLTCHVSACPTRPSTRAPCPPSTTADGHVSEVSCLATFQHVDSGSYQPDQVRLATHGNKVSNQDGWDCKWAGPMDLNSSLFAFTNFLAYEMDLL